MQSPQSKFKLTQLLQLPTGASKGFIQLQRYVWHLHLVLSILLHHLRGTSSVSLDLTTVLSPKFLFLMD